MPDLFLELILLGLAAFSSLVLTGVVRTYALRRLLDVPNERSSHQSPTPRGGGIAIVLTFVMVSIALTFLVDPEFRRLWAILGVLPLALIGLIDDHGHVPARWRLLIQFACVIWGGMWIVGGQLEGVDGLDLALHWMGAITAVVFVVWYINLFNFMDGIDGIAGVEAITLTLSAAAIEMFLGKGNLTDVLLLLLLALSVAGFLCWNWPPARIFMGDVGSSSMGYLLSVLALLSMVTGALRLEVWLILAAAFIVDASLTLIVRFFRGERWYEAHRSHGYQHASRRWQSHRAVSLAFVGINLLWLLPIAALVALNPDLKWPLLLLAYLPLIWAAWWLGAGRP